VHGDVGRQLALILQVPGSTADETLVESVEPGQARRRRLSGVAMVLIVMTLGISVSTVATVSVRHDQRTLAAQAMDRDIDSVSDTVEDGINHYRDALVDLAAGLSSQTELTATDFAALTAALDERRLPGASGVSFVVPATDDEAGAAQAYWRDRGADGLDLYRTGTDAEHAFVIFTRTFTGSALTPGRDLNQTPGSAEPLRIAAETGLFTAGPAHVLLRDMQLPESQRQLSFTLAVPVHGETGTARAGALIGWVTMGVHGEDFFDQSVAERAQGALRIRLTDTADTGGVLARIDGGPPMRETRLDRSRVLVAGQHTWLLTVEPATGLLTSTDRRSIPFVLLSGLFTTGLLAALVGVLAGARVRAMDKVDMATAALRQDIERRQALEQELQRLAFSDPLTGLANRSLFYDRVGHALRSHGRAGESFAVFFVDLDGFKQVNDAFGHSAGDTVLRAVADRLLGCLRESDTVARFGGDEFALVVERLGAPEDVHITAQRIVEAVQMPVDLGGHRAASVTASVGIALNREGFTADDILREADLAMYAAKSTGKSKHVLAGQS
jgi:diguanylate cyclase (GGDEF)-like protein